MKLICVIFHALALSSGVYSIERQVRAKASRRSRSPTIAPTSAPAASQPTRVRPKASKRSRRPRATPSSIPTVIPSADPSNSAFTYSWNETAKFVPSDGAADDLFGRSVSVSGNIAIVGAYNHDENGSNSGAVYVFEKDDSTGYWNETAKFTASDAAADDTFGRSVSIFGNTVIVGANQDDDNGRNSGSAYVYVKDDLTGYWNETAKLTASDAAETDNFGISVSIFGNAAIVGANQNDHNHTNSGSVYVFEKDGFTGQWQETAKLVASDRAADDHFGRSVCLSGNTAIVGADRDDDNGSSSGSAYIFEKDDSTGDWNEIAKLTASDGDQSDRFGQSVSISGTIAIVGASRDEDNGESAGSAYVFEKDEFTGHWNETAKLTASDGAAYEEFGYSVSVLGNVAIVGAYYSDNDGPGSAYVYVKDVSTGGWNETAKIIASDGAPYDQFGYSVSISGNTVIVGTDRDDDKGPSSGSAYVFEASSSI